MILKTNNSGITTRTQNLINEQNGKSKVDSCLSWLDPNSCQPVRWHDLACIVYALWLKHIPKFIIDIQS